MIAKDTTAEKEIAINSCWKLLTYEKDKLVDSIGYVLSGMEELSGKIENVKSQIGDQITAVDEEDKKIAVASEECN